MTDKENEPYQRIKLTFTAYYEPKLGPGGGYWEPGGDYDRGFALAKTVAQAAAYDYLSFRDGQFSREEYLDFGGEDAEQIITVEVVTCTGKGETYEEVCSTKISEKVDKEMFGGNENLTDDLPGMWDKSDTHE